MTALSVIMGIGDGDLAFDRGTGFARSRRRYRTPMPVITSVVASRRLSRPSGAPGRAAAQRPDDTNCAFGGC
jgi:hypothetical protein